MSTELQLVAGSFVASYHPATWQQLANDIMNLGHAVWPADMNNFNVGNSTPTPENRDKPWIYNDPATNVSRLYAWSNTYSLWLAEYSPAYAAQGVGMIWFGTAAALLTYDEGVNEAVDAVHGPFWEVVTELDAKVPIGVGTLPAGVVIGVGTTGGSDKHTILSTELPASGVITKVKRRTDLDSHAPGENSSAFTDVGSSVGTEWDLVSENMGIATPMNIMNPYFGLYFIRRTARIYRTRSG